MLDSESGGDNWHELLNRKLKEMDAMLRNVEGMKQLLQDIRDCDDASLAECIVLTGQRYPRTQT